MARISYVDAASITDPELRRYLEDAQRIGTPRPETQSIRSHVPAVAKAFMRAWERIERCGIRACAPDEGTPGKEECAVTIRIGLATPAPDSVEPHEAWVLDLLGCFAGGVDEPGALAGVQGAIARYLRFACALGAIAPVGPLEVVERFQNFWSETRFRGRAFGPYEVNPIFTTDFGAVGEPEVVFTRTMLQATRPALLAAAERAGGGRPGDRGVGEILHHVAGGEWYYASRLEDDPASVWRFRSDDEHDAGRRLVAIREWSLERIAELPRLGPLERAPGGERWTPRKVLRRFVYHELDHLRELEARARIEAS